jgi:cytochrome c biogenesis protein CcdA
LVPEEPSMVIPVIGQINPQATSLSFLAVVLGFVDGFNPCAMWVLLTFLLILSQVGSRKKMLQVAGLFIVAEAVMYYFILNVWYQTWDFVALDGIVTPAVGILALGSGGYFLYKYISSRNKPLTCDVASPEHQQKTENKIQKLVSKPMTFAVALAIIGLALSVNVIEFACSVGIPQAFTKVLELNNLSFWKYQWYTLVYTIFYMVDDILVFGLAIWGYKKFYAVGQKYSKISTLIAGILMLILGALLVFNPDILAF